MGTYAFGFQTPVVKVHNVKSGLVSCHFSYKVQANQLLNVLSKTSCGVAIMQENYEFPDLWFKLHKGFI